MDIDILFEDENILAVNKPAGLLVHGIFDKHGPKHSEETLVDWLLTKYPEIKDVGEDENRPGIVHRLDRETSGVLLICKTQDAFEYFKSLFQNREIQKTYQALVWGKMKEAEGTIDKAISIIDGSVKRTVFKGKMPRPSLTNYKALHILENNEGDIFSLLEIQPKTGRTHQIRVHLSSLGHPVLGDGLYGKKRDDLGLGRHFLHAQKIEFKNQDGQETKIEAPLAPELEDFLQTLSDNKDD